MFKLAQTLAGSWVITVPNQEERYCSTQIADFDMTTVETGSLVAKALEIAAAKTLAALVCAVSVDASEIELELGRETYDLWEVTSHNEIFATMMNERVCNAINIIKNAGLYTRDNPIDAIAA